MPEVIFQGSDGRLEGRYVHGQGPTPPLAIILHPHPQYGGTMNNRVVYSMFHMFVRRGFSVLRFNFRGVGRSQGVFDHGQGELRDAATALPMQEGGEILAEPGRALSAPGLSAVVEVLLRKDRRLSFHGRAAIATQASWAKPS